MSDGARTRAATRLLLVEFAATDRFHRALLFPFVLGFARGAGRTARWLRFGVPAAAQAGEAGVGVPLSPQDETTLRGVVRAFRPDLVLFNMLPSAGVRNAAGAGRARLGVLVDGGTGGTHADDETVARIDLVRTPLDALLGARDVSARGAGLFQNVAPDHGFEAGNRAAETMNPLPFVFLGEECTYNRSYRASQHLAGLSLAGCLRTGGCAFCGRPAAGGRWMKRPAELLRRQLAAIDR
ncbi:MAG: hypothetical protein QME96_12585, partial [Myxococcota bacterium]|nr:hypothetical protein [Myxococcota bacterium]